MASKGLFSEDEGEDGGDVREDIQDSAEDRRRRNPPPVAKPSEIMRVHRESQRRPSGWIGSPKV
jgi:hypothetical protein